MALSQADPTASAEARVPGDGAAEETPTRRTRRTPKVPTSRRAIRRRQQHKTDVVFWLSIGWVVLMVLCALFSQYLPIQHTGTPSGAPFQGISFSHPFGTDTVGNDLFSLTIRGARMAMIVCFASAALGAVAGGLIGILSGFLHGTTEGVLMWLVDVMLSFPALVFALAIVSFAGASVTSVVLTIAILGIPGYARVARAVTLSYAEQDFVLAARAMGSRPRRIMFREILPNVLVPLGSFAALGAALALIAEGGLAFLGLSAPDAIDWGAMINAGRNQLYQAPQAALAPMLAMFLTIVALNFIGEHFGATVDPRQSNLG